MKSPIKNLEVKSNQVLGRYNCNIDVSFLAQRNHTRIDMCIDDDDEGMFVLAMQCGCEGSSEPTSCTLMDS